MAPLVEKYPDMIHQRDERQLLPFQVAIISKMEQPALKLIEMATVAEVTTEKAGNYTSLSIAAGRGLYKVVQELLDRGADPNFLDGEDNDIVALALGTIHILRKHLYSTKLNFITKFFIKTGIFCQ